MYKVGIDAGSTTIKVVVTSDDGGLLFKDYRRHYADISGSLCAVIQELLEKFGDLRVKLCLTGSAGMGLAERCGFPFVQEVVASARVVRKLFPEIRTLVDVGGEDAKMIFFKDGKSPDIRMNGSCAGGTGAFIDQMASLLNVDVSSMSALAEKSTVIYPIASRCGVFSKTDIQNLLSRNVCQEDIAASVFHAVSLQIMTSLARGRDAEAGVFLCGGPFAHIPALRKAFAKVLRMDNESLIISEHAAVIPAWGASISAADNEQELSLSHLITSFSNSGSLMSLNQSQRLDPLFEEAKFFNDWQTKKLKSAFLAISLDEAELSSCFLGIDSGSTTTKIVALDNEGRVFYTFYTKNKGNALAAVRQGLQELKSRSGNRVTISSSCVTGYGEDLIQKAFSLDSGLVETLAHYKAATYFEPRVSFILDIGGQDMKAVFIDNRVITRLEINEACSSGCGSFIDTFADSLNYNVAEFTRMACDSQAPCDLGTRCTVFMNSRVKQFLREGAKVEDISAGLSYSIIRNCLQKVLKIKDVNVLGEHIMVQGGAFRNPALIRALELETGKEVMITDYPELMGAFGAALQARESYAPEVFHDRGLDEILGIPAAPGKNIHCKGCENQCTVTRFTFGEGQHYFSGNKCEKVYTNRGHQQERGVNLYEEKYSLLFGRSADPYDNAITLGIPRVLGIYENYPFWHQLLTACGFNVVLSDVSTMGLYEEGVHSVMSDNICFPAKLANGHLLNLVSKKVDRIFFPYVVYERQEDKHAANSYNCPIVTAYADVLKSAIDPATKFNIPIDSPSFTFKDEDLMKKACYAYLKGLTRNKKLKRAAFEQAFKHAQEQQLQYETNLKSRCQEILDHARQSGKMVVLLAGRPYHADPLIQHKIAGVITDFGVDVITEDIVRGMQSGRSEVQTVMQWAYTNRIIKAAEWVAKSEENIHYVELTSFGCGPDAFILDEVADVLKREGKNATFLKIDDITNIGSMRLRLRSLIDSLKLQRTEYIRERMPFTQTPPYLEKDRQRKILMPWFGDFYSPFLPAFFKLMGYEAENLPPSDQQSAEHGLKHSNNEICYPATLIVGDFMKALLSGKYKRDEVALAITQTGGQCRATNYIALVKKSMLAAGFDDIPVISISVGSGAYNSQPGFELKWGQIYRELIYCLVFADGLSQLYYASKPREKVAGTIDALREKYFDLAIKTVLAKKPRNFLKLAEMAAADFNNAIQQKDVPRVGIVGEIFVKYNSFGNRHVVNWLVNHGIEPVIPHIASFFLEGLASSEVRIRENIERREKPKILKTVIERYIFGIVHRMESRMASFPYYRPLGNPHDEARHAAEIINLNAQFGEGWLIPAEFARFARENIHNVVSLQPFGCIANHVISKGIEKRTRELFPDLNLLFLDFDSGMSDVNIFNRLHFIAQHAFEEIDNN